MGKEITPSVAFLALLDGILLPSAAAFEPEGCCPESVDWVICLTFLGVEVEREVLLATIYCVFTF